MQPHSYGFQLLVTLLFALICLAGCGRGDSPRAPTATSARVIPTITAESQLAQVPDTNAEFAQVVSNTFIEPATGMTFVHVPAGVFLMGATRAQMDALFELCQVTYGEGCHDSMWGYPQPQHTVYLDEYWIGQTAVTHAQFQQFMDAGGFTTERYWSAAGWQWRGQKDMSHSPCLADDALNAPEQPAVCVSWYEAEAFANWVTETAGVQVRLPTEAEWEKAARGTDGRLFPWGDTFDVTRINECDINCLSAASPYGALGMGGNLFEWIADWYADRYYYVAPAANPTGPDSGDFRTVRGSAWHYAEPVGGTVGRNGYFRPGDRFKYLGFRVVCAVAVPLR